MQRVQASPIQVSKTEDKRSCPHHAQAVANRRLPLQTAMLLVAVLQTSSSETDILRVGFPRELPVFGGIPPLLNRIMIECQLFVHLKKRHIVGCEYLSQAVRDFETYTYLTMY